MGLRVSARVNEPGALASARLIYILFGNMHRL
jgi:hypothetical protein